MKKIHHILFALTALFLAASCTPEVENAFDKPSAERIADAIKTTKDILVAAPNGWKMDYQGAGGFGGYNILCKFDDKDNVTCEEETQHVTSTSHYRVAQGQGVLLSFDSFNAALHKYSDPVGNLNGVKVGKDGKGFEGDFEFRVMSCTKDSIILEGRKHGDRVVMTPMPENLTWDNFFTELTSTVNAMYAEQYNIVIGNDTIPAKMKFHSLYATNSEGKEVVIPFIYTTKGITILNDKKLNGKKLTSFTYSSDDKWLDESDKTIIMAPRAMAPIDALFVDDWTINVGHSSAAEMAIWKTAADYAASQNMPYTTFFFSSKPGFLSLSEYATNGWGDLRTLYTTSGTDQVTIKGFKPNVKGSADEKNGALYYANYKLNEIANTFLVDGNPTTYTLTINDVKHPTSLRMTCNSNSNISFVFDRGVWRVDF